ncbi:MAG: hypothetical protein ACJ76F_13985 [Bacteroidia bacterium]
MSIFNHTLILILLLAYQRSFSDNGLTDPVTNQTISYHIITLSEKANSLNPFEDVDLGIPVIQNNTAANANMKNFIRNFLTDPDYKKRLKEHMQQAIANYVKYSKFGKEISEYDRKMLIEQSAVLESIDSKVLSFYNNLVCIRLQSNYKINQKYSGISEYVSMFQTFYVNVTNGKLCSLIDLCPLNLRTKFTDLLTREKNRVIPLVNTTDDDDDEEEEEEENTGDESEDPVNKNQADQLPPKTFPYLKEKINLIDLVFDVNAMNFMVMKNSSNTTYTKGLSFLLYINEDSLHRYLPWTENKRRIKFYERLKPETVNKELMIYTREINFLYDEYLFSWFANTKNKRTVKVYYRQNFVSDTSFKANRFLTYSSDSLISKIESDFSEEGKPRSLTTYYYEKEKLKKIELLQNDKLVAYHTYSYNKNGFITRYVDYENEKKPREHIYSYADLRVNECSPTTNGNECYSYLFDSTGNFIARTHIGEKSPYVNVYRKTLLMANGDALYSYTPDGRIESVERDRGRYFAKYHYDEEKRIRLIIHYDGMETKAKESVNYDSRGRIIFITKSDYSYGKLQTQVQYKIAYD